MRLQRIQVAFASPGVKPAVFLFLAGRLFFTLWAIVVLVLIPLPERPDESLRPYVGEARLQEGAASLLLGPWQRFDTMRYLALAREGYSDENSVFPPLYPLAIRILGAGLRALTGWQPAVANIVAAGLISNLALLAALILLWRLAAAELDGAAATRTLVYLVFFPVSFFLFAAYSESLFLLLALASIWEVRRGRFLTAGVFGLLASLTRLTGWGLTIPLAYAYLRQREIDWRRPWRGLDWQVVGPLLPAVGLLLFLGWRWLAGLPPLAAVYEQYWYQVTGFPGRDLLLSLHTLVTGSGARAGEFTLVLDLFVVGLLGITTLFAVRRLGLTYGLYNAMLLLFMLLPASDLKPLYSFSRYALVFFPSFMVLAEAGRHPWINRLILYPSVALSLYFSGQFFIWGWVA